MEEVDYKNPQSRNEKILAKIIKKYEGDLEDPQSRIEVLLMELNEYVEQLAERTSGGTPDWTVTDAAADGFIKNKPAIRSGERDTAILEGNASVASASYAHAEGSRTIARGDSSHAEGIGTFAQSSASHTEGYGTSANRLYAHAEGEHAFAQGEAAHAEGFYTVAGASYAHAEGNYSSAWGIGAHAEGESTSAMGKYSHVCGRYNKEDRDSVYVEIVGNGTGIEENSSNARTLDWDGNEWLAGKLTIGADPAEDMDVTTKKYVDALMALSKVQVVETLPDTGESGTLYVVKTVTVTESWKGMDSPEKVTITTITLKPYLWENDQFVMLVPDPVIPNWNTYSDNDPARILNKPSIRQGGSDKGVCEGSATSAHGKSAHAEGGGTYGDGDYSHAEGYAAKAPGKCAHAEGYACYAAGENSHAGGQQTSAYGKNQHVFGAVNIDDKENKYAEIVGNGSYDSQYNKHASNARTLDWGGNEWLAGKLTVGADPTEDMDVTTKKYVDDLIAGLQAKIDALTPASGS